MGDNFIIAASPEELRENIEFLLGSGCSAADLKSRYALGKNYADWVVDGRSKFSFNENRIVPIAYRPFDTRWTYFDNRLLWRWRESVMRHIVSRPNLTIMTSRQAIQSGLPFSQVIAVDEMVDNRFVFSNKGIAQQFPLYLYPDDSTLDQSIRVNFHPKLYSRICKAAELTGTRSAPNCTDESLRATGDARPDEVKVFDYIYGVLHCPAYRETYGEFLKIDFPRVPFPASPEVFGDVSAKGEVLRRLHLLEDAAIGEAPFPFHGDGDSVVGKPRFEGGANEGKVWINATQYFDNVPAITWTFPIGGYQPAQKWLKDRKGRSLGWDGIRHYQKIIKILAETDRIMGEIHLPIASHGGGG